ncbi:MAG: hypothetical protein C5B51_19785 [Terriglobia bacterium]|nr:MAG: hypothetical protein C5B51_19785 [Terriglobia bacterium]
MLFLILENPKQVQKKMQNSAKNCRIFAVIPLVLGLLFCGVFTPAKADITLTISYFYTGSDGLGNPETVTGNGVLILSGTAGNYITQTGSYINRSVNGGPAVTFNWEDINSFFQGNIANDNVVYYPNTPYFSGSTTDGGVAFMTAGDTDEIRLWWDGTGYSEDEFVMGSEFPTGNGIEQLTLTETPEPSALFSVLAILAVLAVVRWKQPGAVRR